LLGVGQLERDQKSDLRVCSAGDGAASRRALGGATGVMAGDVTGACD